MTTSRYYIKQLTSAELGEAKTHEKYIRLTNDFPYEEFFQTAGYQNGTVTQIDFTAYDKNNSNEAISLKFIYYANSNKEKRIPSIGNIFDTRSVKVNDVVILESVTIDDETKIYISFRTPESITINPSTIYYTIVGDKQSYQSVKSVEELSFQLISSDDPTKFVWSCIKLFSDKQDLKQLFTSKYKSLGGSIGNYIRINECYVAQIGKSDIKEIETIQIYDGSFLNAGFDARSIEQFADAVNDVFDGQYKITISDEDGKSVFRLLVLKCAEDKYLPYLSALKTKPFMLLAGISGTGKSRIVRKLAQACWPLNSEQRKAQVPANFCMVQVKPNWHDSSELIGYVSRVSGKSEFVVGDFLKFVAKAWENWLSEDKKPYFLCLDEMNLAPVEQYFAEYLSVLESRKYNAEMGEITSDPIIKNDAEGYSDLLFKLGWKDQTMYDKLSENGICLPPNLIVVGTVNMDETTFSFSRKVLDRAMVIEMNEVNLSGGLTDGADEWDNVELSASDVLPQFVEGKDFYERNEGTCNSIIEKLGLINDVLDGTPFKIAYRTRNEVLLYILNRMSKECSLEYALDEVVNMKILSRIEGDKNKVVDKEGNALLPKLINVIKDVCGENEKSPSLLKLEEMKKKLDKQFYCTYWN